MGFVLYSLPKKSTQLKNKNASALIRFFESDIEVLYLYGSAGSGKTYAIDLLAKEYGYELIYIKPPFNDSVVAAVSSNSLFLSDKKLAIIDVGDTLKAADLKILAGGRWGESRLVIIGDTYSRTNPIRNAFKKAPYEFLEIKFHPFEKMEVLSCLTLYAGELGVKISYDILIRIAEVAAGDMRAARIALRNLIASGHEGALENFLPMTQLAYYSNINKLFSHVKDDVREAFDFFGIYMVMQLIRENLIKYLPKRFDLMLLLKECASLDFNYDDKLMTLAQIVGRLSKRKRFSGIKKVSRLEIPVIDVKCSSVKKLLFYKGFVEWFKRK